MKLKKLFLSLIFTLLFVSPNVFAAKKCAKVVVIGDFCSGKTSIFKKIIGEDYLEEEQMQTKDYRPEDIIETVDQDILHIKIWDTPGLKDFRDEVIQKVDGANIVYFVIDITKRYDSKMEQYLDTMYRTISSRNPNCNIEFLLTKYDRSKDFPTNVIENIKTMEALKIGLENEYFFTSTKDEFACQKQNFIPARDLKTRITEYLIRHIEDLPNKHEEIRITSTWQVSHDLNEKEEVIRHKQDVINWYKPRKGWFTGTCPYND